MSSIRHLFFRVYIARVWYTDNSSPSSSSRSSLSACFSSFLAWLRRSSKHIFEAAFLPVTSLKSLAIWSPMLFMSTTAGETNRTVSSGLLNKYQEIIREKAGRRVSKTLGLLNASSTARCWWADSAVSRMLTSLSQIVNCHNCNSSPIITPSTPLKFTCSSMYRLTPSNSRAAPFIFNLQYPHTDSWSCGCGCSDGYGCDCEWGCDCGWLTNCCLLFTGWRISSQSTRSPQTNLSSPRKSFRRS